jgi:hypothetical protein
MAQYLFKLNKKHTAVINPEAMTLCPEIARLNSKQALFVILYRDYASPYHQQPEHERLLRAKRQAFGTSECSPETEQIVIDAMTAYDSLQYDPRQIQLQRYGDKVISLTNDVFKSDNPKEISLIDGAIEVLNKRLIAIQKELSELAEEESVLKGGQRESHLEKWQRKRREFLRTQKVEEADV